MKDKSLDVKNKKWIIPLAVIIIIVIWGLAWVYMKLALNYMSALTFSALRFLIGTIVLFILAIFIKKSKLSYKNVLHMVVLGVFQTGIVFFLVMYGLQYIGAGKGALLLYSMPVWSAVFSVILLKERISSRNITGLIIGVVGLVIILGMDFLIIQSKDVLIGEMYIVVAAVAWGFANIYYRKHLDDVPIIQVSAYQMMFGTLGLFIAAYLIEGTLKINWTYEAVYYLLFTGIFASAVAFSLWYYVLKRINTITATVSMMMVPVVGIVLSYFMIGEVITMNILIGGLFILFGLYITQTKSANNSK